MVDWSAGHYESTAFELEPASVEVVTRVRIGRGDRVLDLACGTGNASLVAASAGSGSVTGVDSATRLLGVARARAAAAGLPIEFVEGDLLSLPIADDFADVAISVFGLIFAPDPARAVAEVARVLAPGGRVGFSAWLPSGPISEMLAAVGRTLAQATGAPAPVPRFIWSDRVAVAELAAGAGLALTATAARQVAFRDESVEGYLTRSEQNPMSFATLSALRAAGVEDEARAAMRAVLHEANEDPGGFLVHSPYVIHELRAA